MINLLAKAISSALLCGMNNVIILPSKVIEIRRQRKERGYTGRSNGNIYKSDYIIYQQERSEINKGEKGL